MRVSVDGKVHFTDVLMHGGAAIFHRAAIHKKKFDMQFSTSKIIKRSTHKHSRKKSIRDFEFVLESMLPTSWKPRLRKMHILRPSLEEEEQIILANSVTDIGMGLTLKVIFHVKNIQSVWRRRASVRREIVKKEDM